MHRVNVRSFETAEEDDEGMALKIRLELGHPLRFIYYEFFQKIKSQNLFSKQKE